MTVKLALLKSGEDVIADMQEMIVGDEENQKVVGYFFTKPCVVKLSNPEENLVDKEGNKSFEIKMFPWNPLSKDSKIPITADWVVTLVEPVDKLKEMYENGVLNYGKQNGQSNSTDEQPDSDQSD